MRLGFAGLGTMGAGIAQRLGDAGHPVTVWNRTRAKAQPLLADGMAWAETPRELAAASDVLFTMLTNTRAVEAIADDVLAGLRAGTIWADLSTIAPDASVALAGRVRARDAFFLDCPVSGSPATLAAGQMSVMAGGDPAAPTGDVAEVVRLTAELLAACGERLRPGEIVITGSVVPPVPLAPGQRLRAELHPLGAVAVELL